MPRFITENEIEQIALDILNEDLGYTVLYGPDITGSSPFGGSGDGGIERDYNEVVLQQRLKNAIEKINPDIPADAKEEAFKKALRTTTISLFENNQAFHQMLTEGIDVRYRLPSPDGEGAGMRSDKVWLIDFANPENNEFIAINQFTVIENHNNKRPDIVLFVNGLPLVVIELKNAIDENADVKAAFNQLQTYKQLIPSLFTYNAFLIVSDGWFAKGGTLSSDYSRFMEWKTADGVNIVDTQTQPEMEPMIKGLLNKKTLLDVVRHFIVYEKTKEKTIKKIAAYHQYYAVNKAITKTIEATTSNEEDKKGRAGVVWHTQGSGKSLSMVFYAGKLVLTEQMNNPTIVVLTDRNDLDQQLFETFGNCEQLIRQKPKQAENRDDLKDKLSVASGGVVFTTIQKFLPENTTLTYPKLSDRRNIVVIADEAHRSQYDFIDGYAKHMRDALPNASFIGFTGTPIEKEDKNTQSVFGNYIDVYDIHQAVLDGATVRIYYESRLAKIELNENDQKLLDMPHAMTDRN
jgi:type I restriction enzyme R subunit